MMDAMDCCGTNDDKPRGSQTDRGDGQSSRIEIRQTLIVDVILTRQCCARHFAGQYVSPETTSMS